ncbi:MAG: outer membrane protein assembly factor BamA [Candidatus Marinimicrobia bacterium]|nr:outer membrane protein assembly factor BamA [Candidatus Neomarinimicrobiota bacterium]MCF7839273.1 outer membrane protein assembly factor BamA [Candidatus Neomarinimicrobiota bacterium]MCF7903399.1 outer membrane protein assembly factor BamA [Candidatus Neomarinimicrobiota bacterium]
MRNYSPKILTLLLFFVIVSSLSAQATKVNIYNITVVGNTTASPDVIIQNSGLRPGTEVNADAFGDAVRQLWNLGLFSDIKIIADQQTPEGIYLIISVEEYPRLEKIVLEGNKKIKSDDIEEELKLYTGQVLSPNAVYEAQRKIEQMYLDKGYLLAEVTPSTFEGEKENTRGIRFEIKENKKVKVFDINFIENVELSDWKLRRQMEKIKQERWWKFWAEAEYSIANLRADESKIVDYYKSQGFRDAEIVRDSIYYSEDMKKMFVDIRVYEGAQYKYGDITISGNTLFPTENILKALNIERGDIYNSENLLEKIEANVRGPYMDRGYLYAQVNTVEIPVAEDTVDLKLDIVEYSPVKVRHINIVGNDKTKENVIRRELRVFPGDQFSRTALMRSQREIMILNYFNNVVPDVIPVDDDEIDLEFAVEEKQTGMATASAGYSERDGMIGTLGMQFPNFLGNGQQLSFNLQRAYSYRSFSVSFTEPWLFDTPNLLGVSLFDTDRTRGDLNSYFGATTSSYSYTPYDMHSTGGSLTFGRRFRWPDNYFRGRWIFQAMRNLYDLDKVYDWSIFNQVNPANLETTSGLSLRQIITRDSRNAPEFPTAGSVLNLSTTYSGGLLGGNESFFKQEASLEWYSPLGHENLTWRNRGEMGYLTPLDDDLTHIIPYDEYFFMGGAGLIWGTALRGYPERSVRPPTTAGIWYGGKSLFKVTSELRLKLSPNPLLYLLLFAEAGNTWRDWNETNFYDLKRSVGFGGRIIMQPIGLLGIDLGWGFDRESLGLDKASWRSPEVHFIFGQQF